MNCGLTNASTLPSLYNIIQLLNFDSRMSKCTPKAKSQTDAQSPEYSHLIEHSYYCT